MFISRSVGTVILGIMDNKELLEYLVVDSGAIIRGNGYGFHNVAKVNSMSQCLVNLLRYFCFNNNLLELRHYS